MCVITISLALCDTTCPYPDADVPAGCLRIYPFTSGEIHCPDSEGVLGSCGYVEMCKGEGEDGSRVEKRLCESCVAWSALMRRKDGLSKKRRHDRGLEGRGRQQDGVWDRDGREVVLTPVGSLDSLEFELDVEKDTSDGGKRFY